MRFVAALIFLLTLAAAAMAGQVLWQEIATPPQDDTRSGTDLPETAAAPPASPPGARRWPALFGEPQPPRPPAPPEPAAEPQPPATPLPPLSSLGYDLRGVVRTEGRVWAVVGHPTGSKLVRAGDELARDVMVERIDGEGLWLSRQGNPEERLAFPE
ncbi:type II secretion system protein N [Oceanicola sp. 22II-s10i]|uniref:type II secretion system protein N n=1 Tax=Oceanicola sp. 22II-s10i TaxID=1317116 RepID=UPI000B525B8B|nr:type II secretion system protein N [Oceanicola sp. 22II-s10i]